MKKIKKRNLLGFILISTLLATVQVSAVNHTDGTTTSDSEETPSTAQTSGANQTATTQESQSNQATSNATPETQAPPQASTETSESPTAPQEEAAPEPATIVRVGGLSLRLTPDQVAELRQHLPANRHPRGSALRRTDGMPIAPSAVPERTSAMTIPQRLQRTTATTNLRPNVNQSNVHFQRLLERQPFLFEPFDGSKPDLGADQVRFELPDFLTFEYPRSNRGADFVEFVINLGNQQPNPQRGFNSSNNAVLIGNPQNRPRLNFTKLMHFSGELYVENVDLFGEIQVVGAGKLTLVNCTVNNNPVDTQKRPSSYPQFRVSGKNAIVQFDNVEFRTITGPNIPEAKVQLSLENQARGILDHCTFSNPTNTAILVTERSSAGIRNSHFSNAPGFAIYTYKSSRANLEHCSFENNATDLFVFDCSEILGDQLEFLSSGSAVSVATKSRVKLTNSQIQNCHNPAIKVNDNSEFNCLDSSFLDCNSNALKVTNSSGLMLRCLATSANPTPVVFVSGHKSDFVFARSKLNNTKGSVCAVHDLAKPAFSEVIFENEANNYVVSTSDCADPSFDHCEFNSRTQTAFRIENGAQPMIHSSKISTKPKRVFQFRKGSFGPMVTTTPNAKFVGSPAGDPTKTFTVRLQENPDHLDPINPGFTVTKQPVIETDQINDTINQRCYHHGDFDRSNYDQENYAFPCCHLLTTTEAMALREAIDQRQEATCPECLATVTEIGTIHDPHEADIPSRCPVCLHKHVPKAFLAPCGHTVCPQCYSKYVEIKGSQCPVCRAKVTAHKIIDFSQAGNRDLRECLEQAEENPELNQEAEESEEEQSTTEADFSNDQQATADQDQKAQKADQTDQHEASTEETATNDQTSTETDQDQREIEPTTATLDQDQTTVEETTDQK